MTLGIAQQMQCDAFTCLAIALCTMVLISEDRGLSLFWQFVLGFAGFFYFAQATWLAGVWLPGQTGFPWPRLGADGVVGFGFLVRTVSVLWALHVERREARKHMRRRINDVRTMTTR